MFLFDIFPALSETEVVVFAYRRTLQVWVYSTALCTLPSDCAIVTETPIRSLEYLYRFLSAAIKLNRDVCSWFLVFPRWLFTIQWFPQYLKVNFQNEKLKNLVWTSNLSKTKLCKISYLYFITLYNFIKI